MQREEVEHVLRAAAAISKEAAGREKDAGFVRVLLRDRLVELETLLTRIGMLPLEASAAQRIADWTRRRAAEAMS